MRSALPVHRILLPLLLTGFLLPTLSAAPPDRKAVEKLVTQADAAQKAVDANVPKSRGKQEVEDLLDLKERELQDANAARDRVRSDPKATPKEKKEADEKAKSAQTQRDATKLVADNTPPTNNTAYRKALTQRRDARKALEDARKALEEVTGREGRALRRLIREALERTKPKSLGGSMGGFLGTSLLLDLVRSGTLALQLEGTGETIGDVARARLTNTGETPVRVAIPPMVLVSISGQSQHYAVPDGQTVTIAPESTVTVPLDGVCISRSKPPVKNGVQDELYAQLPGGTALHPTPPRGELTGLPSGKPAFTPSEVDTILAASNAIQDTVDELLEKGELNGIPYKDKEQKRETAQQWATWADPTLSEITGEKPATTEDLSKTVTRQVPNPDSLSAPQKEALERGITAIWDAIQLTGEAAKSTPETRTPFQLVNPTLKI